MERKSAAYACAPARAGSAVGALVFAGAGADVFLALGASTITRVPWQAEKKAGALFLKRGASLSSTIASRSSAAANLSAKASVAMEILESVVQRRVSPRWASAMDKKTLSSMRRLPTS